MRRLATLATLIAIAAGSSAGAMGLIHAVRASRSVTCDIPGAPVVIVEQCRKATQVADARDDRDTVRFSY